MNILKILETISNLTSKKKNNGDEQTETPVRKGKAWKGCLSFIIIISSLVVIVMMCNYAIS